MCCLARNSFVFTSNVTATVVQSAYIHIHIQDVSEKGGHILDTWYMDQNKGKASKMCLRRRSFFIMITSGIKPHENNSHFRQQYQWSYDDWIVTDTFKFVQYTCKPITTRGPSVRLVLLHIMLPLSYSDI
jgi:hypothetical protein